MLLVATAVAVLAAAVVVRGDVYMINPRGSNNRHHTEGNQVNVENNNRLFNSQNNDDGGYDVGAQTENEPHMKYFVGSFLNVEWSSQHACGKDSTTHCNVVLQYMCDDAEVRDGSSNDRVEYNEDTPTDSDARGRGMHENWYHYHACDRRERNKGLFFADQNPGGNDARYTRQQPNQNRRGLECEEERDYYPYWAPSPWRDIAIITDDVKHCDMYQAESQNTKARHMCVNKQTPVVGNTLFEVQPHITQQDCVQAQRDDQDEQNGQADPYAWEEFPAHYQAREEIVAGGEAAVVNKHVPFYNAGVKAERAECKRFAKQVEDGALTQAEADAKCLAVLNAPACIESTWQRDNHLGTVMGGHFANYTWQIPDDVNERCVLRLRYNISTSDYDGWNTFSDRNGGKRTGISPVEQDAQVQWNWNYPIELAINTNQFGRTFQDRSHTFAIRERPASISPDFALWNVNVRGRRGHVTQTYPLPGYDFVPRDLHIDAGAYVHFQWTGASGWPEQYYGMGLTGTDRHNVVQIASMQSNFPLPADQVTMFTPEQALKFAMVGQQERGDTACSTRETIVDQTNYDPADPYTERQEKLKDIRETPANCALLNQADSYFNHEPIQFNTKGAYYYMCTRNNRPGFMPMKAAIYVE